jgi:hypothetical protein
MVGERLMRLSGECFRNYVCLNIYDRIDCMRMLGELIMIKRTKSLERRYT